MITANIYEITAFLLVIAFLILIIFAIPALLQIKKTAKAVENLSQESKKSLETLNGLLKSTSDKKGDLEALFRRLSDFSRSLGTTADIIGGSLKGPFITLISLIIGIQYGLKYFIKCSEEEKGGDDVKGQK